MKDINRNMTKIQAQILAYVREFITKHGYSPSFAEIAKGVKTWPGTARVNVIELGRRGYLVVGKGVRNIRLPDEGHGAHAA